MTTRLDGPVVLILFNRPDKTEATFERIRRARPRRLFLVADGPRPDHPDDADRCHAARAVVGRVDWPCDVARDFAPENLGCDPRIESGLDWVFDNVDQAIILEDDVVVDLSFFSWCATMLDRFADEPDVMQISGRNELGRYGPPGADHLAAHWGSNSAWATWSSAWRRARALDDALSDTAAATLLADQRVEPLLKRHLELHLDARASGRALVWDARWTLARVLAGGVAVTPPVNLVDHIGFDAEATHVTSETDPRAAIPVGPTPLPASEGPHRPVDSRYDRWALLVALIATYRRPAAVRRLAASRRLLESSGAPVDPMVLHHLAPFELAAESQAVLAHLKGLGVHSPVLDEVETELAHCRTRGRR